MKRSVFALVLALVMLVSSAAVGFAAETSYPLEFDGTITWWLPLNSNVAGSAADLNDTPFAAHLQEALGVNIEFVHPTVGAENEGFTLMLAGNDLTDIVEGGWHTRYEGGYDAAISNGFVLNLADYAELMPNYMAALDSNDAWRLAAYTATGNLPAFMFIRGDVSLQVYAGMIIRKDWLEELNLEVPTTIDEWTEMLTIFRDEKGATTPMITRAGIPDIFDCDAFVGAYGAAKNFFLDEGTVKYGPLEEGYLKTLELFNSWFEADLFTSTFVTDDGAAKNAHILNGDGGAFYGLTGSGIGTLINNARLAGDEVFDLVGAPYPVVNEGDYPEFGFYDNAVSGDGTTVSPTSENIELCIKMLDYGYSAAGDLLYNFGVEGDDYDMVDGKPIWNDTVIKNPDGLAIGHAIARAARSSYGGPFIQNAGYIQQYLQLDTQKAAVATWMDTNAADHKMPNVVIAEADAEEYNQIMAEINTFIAEYTALAIDGTYDLANYESECIDVLKDIGIERALEIRQAAYDAFIAR